MAAAAATIGRRQLFLADLLSTNLLRDVLLVPVDLGVAGALAQVVIPLRFTPVAVTGRALGVLLVGCARGWRRFAEAVGSAACPTSSTNRTDGGLGK